MSRNKPKFGVYQEITDRIVAALETAGEFRLPWIRNKGGSMKRPANIASAKPYNGVNVVSLWVAAQACEYPSHLWGTYRQWQERGCQVRRGEILVDRLLQAARISTHQRADRRSRTCRTHDGACKLRLQRGAGRWLPA
jgi:antirestriction protein ArdC